ncbi:MAG: 4-(cytidine 5'-diphospho)-2-C-methyl-D-erythritol kinase [Sedimentisphaerales bacterium]|nr:4-(cytidine 5'-diphospho)-2-C-methyl-D-erythritol kinase [Sedimentisphaerales bacterium]
MTEKEQFETIGDGLLVRAPAKLNLSLLIAGKRPDGFHEIETIMAKVNFYDEILIQQSQKTGVQLLCIGPQWAPQGEENLVYKAAQILLENSGRGGGIKITLTKNIPAGSGLGSASSDAAAALIGLNKYLNLQFPNSALAEIAAQLGSDVAFFLDGSLAFCTGKGEKIRKLNKKFNFLALLILPVVTSSTQKVYANYKHNPALYETLHTQINYPLTENRIDLVTKMCANMLEMSCFSLYGELADLKAKIESLGIRPLCLSGSGSAMFHVIDNCDIEKGQANKILLEEQTGCKAVLVSNSKW